MQIGLAGWSLHRRFNAKELKLLDYPKVVREEFGLGLAELNSPFFESTDEDYLDKLVEAGRAADVRFVHISVDGHGNLAATDEAERAEAVARHVRWFAVAKRIGAGSFRANTGGSQPHSPEELDACKRSFRELAEESRKTGVALLIENHGGISASPEAIAEICETAGADAVGTCPDFGNFAPEILYDGLEKITPFARVVHAKTKEFGPDGEEVNFDAGRCIDILRKGGFDGPLMIEFEGEADDHDGVVKSVELLRRHT